MPKRLSSHAFIDILTSNGFHLISRHGSHAMYRDEHSHTVIVPHPRMDIPIGTIRSMIRQCGLPKNLFD